MNKTEIILLAALALVVVFGLIGWVSSPLDENGRPVMLLPDVKAVEDYRRQAVSWTEDLRLLDGRLSTLLAGNSEDLLGQSRSAQNSFQDSLNIVQEIDYTDAPPALVGLRESLSNTSLAYLEASRGILRWVSSPNQANRDQAANLIKAAQAKLYDLESSTWLIP